MQPQSPQYAYQQPMLMQPLSNRLFLLT
jgi:hypothetical protein